VWAYVQEAWTSCNGHYRQWAISANSTVNQP
jgi:hypothetical protein